MPLWPLFRTRYELLGSLLTWQGYDMEDAMIINKSSHERGFAAAHITTTKVFLSSFARIFTALGG
jgi:DNA-directed RNA polymerase beta subunit